MNVQQAITDFLQHGQAVRNLSDRTIRAYQSDLSQFHLHVSDANMVDITPQHLEDYLEKLGTGPYRDTSIRRKVAALKVFFRYLEEKGVVSESPARKIHPPRKDTASLSKFRSKCGLDSDEIQRQNRLNSRSRCFRTVWSSSPSVTAP